MWQLIVITWWGSQLTADAAHLEFETEELCNEERSSIENLYRSAGERDSSGKFAWIVGDCQLTLDDPS